MIAGADPAAFHGAADGGHIGILLVLPDRGLATGGLFRLQAALFGGGGFLPTALLGGPLFRQPLLARLFGTTLFFRLALLLGTTLFFRPALFLGTALLFRLALFLGATLAFRFLPPGFFLATRLFNPPLLFGAPLLLRLPCLLLAPTLGFRLALPFFLFPPQGLLTLAFRLCPGALLCLPLLLFDPIEGAAIHYHRLNDLQWRIRTDLQSPVIFTGLEMNVQPQQYEQQEMDAEDAPEQTIMTAQQQPHGISGPGPRYRADR